MLKKVLVTLVAAALVAAPASTGALAKGKKKGPKPYVSPEVTIQVGHTAQWGASGTLVSVTAQEFLNTCAIPNSNGVDAYVFAVPDDYKGLEATVKAIGSGSLVQAHDLDLYLFDESCQNTAVYNPTNTDEFGILTADTAFIVVHLYAGEQVKMHIELTPPKK